MRSKVFAFEMNKPLNMKNRQRGRNNGGKPRPMGGGGGGNRNPNFDGGNMRPRGNAQQLMEKFLAMARDASAMGDRVAAENYFQHADHYYRVLNARFEAQQQNNFHNNGQRRDHQQRYDRQGGDLPDDGQAGAPGYERQDFNRAPHAQPYGEQPYAEQQPPAEAQPAYQPAPAYQPPQPAVPEQDIGLPPAILGMEEPARAPQEEQALEPAAAGGDGRSPRRRRGRGHGGHRASADTARE
jgi:hypothetical protein